MEAIFTDQMYMRRALQLAERGKFHTAPNPMVGCVIVCNDRIIGEGYHRCYGQPHAEVNAIASVKESQLLTSSTLYVSLEPCSHYGKTPPCCDLLIRKGIHRVVIGMKDPNPLVGGQGIERLRKAGIQVEVGILESECRALNKRFLTFIEQKRPYVILKWAESADGYLDLCREECGNGPVRISNAITKATNHEMRASEAAIMVGTRTALLDNPHLTVRKWKGPNPVRILLDRKLRVPTSHQILNEMSKTIIFNEIQTSTQKNLYFKQLCFDEPIVPQIYDYLHEKNISSLIVEGGSQLLNTFIESNLWDECHIETAPIILGEGVKRPNIDGIFMRAEKIEENVMSLWKNPLNKYL